MVVGRVVGSIRGVVMLVMGTGADLSVDVMGMGLGTGALKLKGTMLRLVLALERGVEGVGVVEVSGAGLTSLGWQVFPGRFVWGRITVVVLLMSEPLFRKMCLLLCRCMRAWELMPLVKMVNPLDPRDGLITKCISGLFMKVQFPPRVRVAMKVSALQATRLQSGCTRELLDGEISMAQRVGVALMLLTLQALPLTL